MYKSLGEENADAAARVLLSLIPYSPFDWSGHISSDDDIATVEVWENGKRVGVLSHIAFGGNFSMGNDGSG